MANKTGKGVLLLLVNSNSQILLQHRDDDAPAYPGQWGLFGGAVEPGETVRQAMLREAMEELRYDAKNAQLAFVCQGFNEALKRPIERHYFMDHFDTAQMLELNEGQAMEWFTFAEMQTLDLAPMITAEADRIQAILAG